MPFDIESAMDVSPTDTIPTTKFDISSAQDVVTPPPARPPSPISSFLRKIFRDSPIEQMQTQFDLVKQADAGNIPEVQKGESFDSYLKRFNEKALKPRETAIANEGVLRQVEVPMTGAIMAGGLAKPVGTALAVGSFSIADHFFNARRWVEENAPDTNPLIKDLVEIADFAVKGAVIGAGFDAKDFVMKRFDKLNLPKAVDIPADQVAKLAELPKATEDLGIKPDQVSASINSDTPITVPVEKVMEVVQTPKWVDIKQAIEGGDLSGQSKGKSGQEKGLLLNAEPGATPASDLHAEAKNTPTAPVSLEPTIKELAQDNAKSSEAALQSAIKLRNDTLAENNPEKAAKAQVLIDKISKPTLENNSKEVKVTKVSREQLPIGSGIEKASGLEARVKQTLQEAPDNIKNVISNYQEMNKKEQMSAAAQYVSSKPEEALAVLKGERKAPKGLLHNSIALALEEHAANANDANLVLKLASLRSTRAGQEISILTERNPNSPITYIDELMQRKIETLGDKEAATKIREKQVKEITKAIKKPTKGDWTAFIESIRC